MYWIADIYNSAAMDVKKSIWEKLFFGKTPYFNTFYQI